MASLFVHSASCPQYVPTLMLRDLAPEEIVS